MDSSDTQSICTDAPTLVGSTRNRLSDGTEQHISEILPGQGPSSDEGASVEPTITEHDRTSFVTRSSTSTLLAQPARQTSAPPADRSRGQHDDEHDAAFGLFDPSDSRREEDLTVPWWSAILPSPSLTRSRGRSAFRRPSRGGVATDTEAHSPPWLSSTSQRIVNSPPSSRRTGQSFLQRSFSSPRALTAPVSHQSSPAIAVSASPSLPNASTASPTRIASASSSPISSSPPMGSEQTIFPEPPPLPEPYGLYTKCYCEENVYILAAHLDSICRQRNANERSWRWSVDVCFVSNANTTVALWQQRASNMPENGNLVIWDYHVFCIVTCSSASEDDSNRPSRSDSINGGWVRENEVPMRTSWVYDLDTTLPVPHPLSSYLTTTFRADRPHAVSAGFRPLFRVIPAGKYLAYFASDRSHMIVERSREDREMEHAMRASVGFLFEQAPPQYTSPPPRWSLIRGPLSTTSNNLFDLYVEMDARQTTSYVDEQGSEDDQYGVIVSVDELMRGVGLAVRGQGDSQPRMDPAIQRMVRQLNGAANTPVATLPVERVESADNLAEPQHAGHLIGLRRVYGHRPPPPPPGQDRFSRIDFSGRGKRVTNPLFPAYMHATLQSRAATLEAMTSSSNPVAAVQTATAPASAS